MSSTDFSLPPSKITSNVIRVLGKRLVPIVRSSPGLGKSAILKGIGREYRLKIYDFRLGQMDVTDLNGLPFRNDDGTFGFLPFEDFPLEGSPLPPILDKDGNQLVINGVPQFYDGWLLFFDELTSAPKHMQAASYKILLDRMVGNRMLHAKVMMAAAGNLASDKAVVHDMSTALQSRLIHFVMHCDHKEWMQWASKNGIDSRIMAYLEFRQDDLHRFDPDHQDHTFACPRTWEFASDLIKGTDVTADDIPLLAGTVSPGPAQQFVAFCEVYATLPKIADIIADPKTAQIPDEASAKYAMTTHLLDKIDQSNAGAFAEYIQRYPIEFQAITVRLITDRHPALIRHPGVQPMWTAISAYL